MVMPFILLLLGIALGPLVNPGWWSRQYAKIALGLGLVTLVYYLLGIRDLERVLATGTEYVSFICLIGSLFVVSGGIHITVKGEAKPRDNVLFLFFGGLIASVLGTTGASMLLIRPWIRMNKYRVTGYHVVFFIFIVSNVGGGLTPIGDPPLFLGYLQGVPFWWVVKKCWAVWLLAMLLLLSIFFVIDTVCFRKAPKSVRVRLTEPEESWQFRGTSNLFFLAVILCSVFIDHPRFLREGLMVGAALGSYFTTPEPVHTANDFNFSPIREVAIIFAGIFATMIPALDWLQHNAVRLGTPTPAFFFWVSGSLSSILDNAPTYLSFFSVLQGTIDPDLTRELQHLLQSGVTEISQVTGPNAEKLRLLLPAFLGHATSTSQAVSWQDLPFAGWLGIPEVSRMLMAISVGSVFFGANTYIGNGPNFMVKAIADQQKVHTPSFLAYIAKFTLPVMLPVLFAVWRVFFW